MNIKHFSNDVQALAKAQRSGDRHILQTSSGKLKENTLFERVIGQGKELISKISGGSYKINKISTTDGKEVIQNRFNAQLRFFSENNCIDAPAEKALKNKGNEFLEALLKSDLIFSNPKQALTSQITQRTAAGTDSIPSEITAFQNLASLYSDKDSSAKFQAKAREFDHLRDADENAVVSKEVIAHAEKLGSLAERAHKGGATKDHAYFIAKLALDPATFTASDDEDRRYNVAVSTFLHAWDSGIREFEKFEKILPLKKDEANAVRELQNIRNDLRQITRPDSSNNTANKNMPRTENNSPDDNKSRIDDKEFMYVLTRALNDGATPQEAQLFASLMLDHFPEIPKEQEERLAPVMSTLMIAHANNIKNYAKLKEIFVLKYAEATAERKLWEIHKDINKTLFSK